MLPNLYQLLILTLAAYRITRLIGWDDWPPIAKLRAKILGEYWITSYPEPMSITDLVDRETIRELLGKTPTSEVPDAEPAYDRPTLAHLVHCPFCLGWWVSLAVYGAWLGGRSGTLLVLAPFALSGAVGLVAKNLDP